MGKLRHDWFGFRAVLCDSSFYRIFQPLDGATVVTEKRGQPFTANFFRAEIGGECLKNKSGLIKPGSGGGQKFFAPTRANELAIDYLKVPP